MHGPGKYDDICTQARESAEADGVILVVFGGKHGHGFSVQAKLPGILESVARQIRADIELGGNGT